MRLRGLAIRPYWSLRSSSKSGLHSGTLTFFLINSQKSRHARNNIIHSPGSEPVTYKQAQLACGGEVLPGRCCPGGANSQVVLERRDKYVKTILSAFSLTVTSENINAQVFL